MQFVMFYHTLVSDWNHGNAHFLRGVATELLSRGHRVKVLESEEAWSARNLVAEHGGEPIRKFHEAYPSLSSCLYNPSTINLEEVLEPADVVIVHEWSDHELVRRIGKHHAKNNHYRLYFHDTHHRMVTAPESMAAYDLSEYDGVLAYGLVLKDLYLASGRVGRAWTWHEAADTRVFKPFPSERKNGDLVWIGNWGDGERSAELSEFLIEPSKALNLRARIYGVRYSDEAKNALAGAGIEYCGWLPNFEAPKVFAQYSVTVHVPRRPYVEALPGIPTIRPFEALACGIPLVCSPWQDAENLFRPGQDYLVARNGAEMQKHLRDVLHDQSLAMHLIEHGLETIRARHTCAHRVNELLAIDATLNRAPKKIAQAEETYL
ncbi:MAG TPA: glycosyltransferase [Candidatus Saccharimonadales bacterium]|nr:glycosyltransferase [Candidatus Saccharimonadales bacterium]